MKIDRFEIRHYRLRYSRPVRWFNSSEEAGDYLALRLFADGASGVAEATIKPTWCGLSIRSFAALVSDLLVPAVQNIDAGNSSDIARALATFPGNPIAKGLVQNACAALAANAAGQPLWLHLGGGNRVEVSWCVTRQTPRLMAEEAERMVARYGFRALKVKGGQGMDVDAEALRLIRCAVGAQVGLTVDANGAYDVGDCLDYLKLLHDEGVVVAEDPGNFLPDAGFSKLVAAAPLPILVDSPCTSVDQARAFLDAGASAISIKPGRVGIHEAGSIEALAAQYRADLCSGMFAESALGTYASLCYASTLKLPFLPAEQTFFLLMREQLMEGALEIGNGEALLGPDHDLDGLADWSRTEQI